MKKDIESSQLDPELLILPTHTGIDKERLSESWWISSKVIKVKTTETIQKILEPNTLDHIKKDCEKYFPGEKNKVLRDFFAEHPTRYNDLQRTIASHVIISPGTETAEIPSEYHSEIYEIFLINGKHDTAHLLYPLIGKLILDNDYFLQKISNHPSILDSGGYTLRYLSKKEIEWLITQWLVINIHWCKYDNSDIYFARIFPKILKYLPRVYGRNEKDKIYNEILDCKDIKTLASRVFAISRDEKHSGYGKRRTDVWRVVQAFHQWGNIDEIEESFDNAKEYAEHKNMKTILKQSWIILNDEYNVTTEDGVMIYHGSIIINNTTYPYIWRPKSILSTLKKIAETPEYTNRHAIRDSLAGTIIFPDSNNNEKWEFSIGSKLSYLYKERWYIAKNKWFYKKEIFETLENGKRKPMFISYKLGDTSNPLMENASWWGFVEIDKKLPCGFEVQVLTQSAYEWKKNDDARYKIYGVLNLESRWNKFLTPWDLHASIKNLVSSASYEKINKAILADQEDFVIQNTTDIINYLIYKGKIHVLHNNDWEIIFVPHNKLKHFLKIMKEGAWKKCTDPSIWKIITTLLSTHENVMNICGDVAPSIT